VTAGRGILAGLRVFDAAMMLGSVEKRRVKSSVVSFADEGETDRGAPVDISLTCWLTRSLADVIMFRLRTLPISAIDGL
jgi:hypothetical protein